MRFSSRMADLDLYRIVGAGLAARRKELRLRQSEVADRIGLTRASLANIERLAHVLGVAPWALLKPPEVPAPTKRRASQAQ